MSLRDKLPGRHSAASQFQSKTAEARAKKEQKELQQKQKAQSKQGNALNKIADNLDKNIAKAFKKGEESFCIYVHGANDSFIRQSEAYRRMHEFCARPDINMQISIISKWHRPEWRWDPPSHSDSGIQVYFNSTYSTSPDAPLFKQPEPAPQPVVETETASEQASVKPKPTTHKPTRL
jgi:hypothetical protein